MQIRKIKGDERFEARLISAVAFHESIEDIEKAKKETEEQTDEDWGAFSDEGKLMARIINNHFTTFFDGNLISNGGIGAVSTLPEYRATGAVKAIFRELLPQVYRDGEVISTLYPFNHAFYRKVGYETISWQNEYTFAPGVLQNYRFGGEAVLWKPGDSVKEYTDLYNRFASSYNLAAQRTEESMYKAHVKGEYYKDRKFCYLLKEDKEAVAYVIFKDQKTDSEAELFVQDLAWIGRKGFLAILGFLARFSADYGTIKLFFPSDLDLFSVIQSPRAYDIQKTGIQAYMARVINARELLSLMKKPDEEAFVIKVTDDIIQENNKTWKVAGKEVTLTDASPDLIVSEKALAQLALGSVSLTEAMYREDVEVCANTELLKRIFVRKPILIEEHF